MLARDFGDYTTLVDECVAGNAARETDWSALVEALPSVYPEVVRDSARRLGVWSNVRVDDSVGLGVTVTSKAHDLWLQGKLRTPHILDGCWWFTDGTLKWLSELAIKLGTSGDAMGLFGAPTLYHHMRSQGIDRELMLVDRGVSCDLAAGRTVQADMLQRTPTLSRPASVSVVDPPWYIAETQAFLLAARRNSDVGAKILVSVPPIGTRPGILPEWEEMVLWCTGIGLRLIERIPLVLRYLSPPFESNALRAAGVPPCRIDWRRGDLAVFEAFAPFETPSAASPTVHAGQWRDLEIGRVHLKIRIEDTIGPPSTLLEEIVPGSVLPSVSRRDPRLESVALWTSGNRVFSSGAPAALGGILNAVVMGDRGPDLYSGGRDPSLDSCSRMEIELTAAKLRRIIEIEELELERWSRSLNDSLVELAS